MSEAVQPRSYVDCSQRVVQEIEHTLGQVNSSEVEELIDMIARCDRVFFVGVGRVLLSLESIAKRLNHLGIETVVVGQITEPAITERDLLIVGSGSGATGVPLFIARKAKSFKAKVAHIGMEADSPMAEFEDLFVQLPASSKRDRPGSVSIQPMTSLFEQCLLLLGDVMALMMVNRKELDLGTLWRHHANLE